MPNIKQFPPLVSKLVWNYNGWIVGSAAKAGADLSKVRDFDILVPFHDWPAAACLITKDAVPTRFGGWKLISNEVEVDVWPDDVGRFLLKCPRKDMWHPSSGIRITHVSDNSLLVGISLL